MVEQKRKLGLLEVKQAFLADVRFREMFLPDLKTEIDAALKNPTCACNRKLYDRFFEFPEKLASYFPNREIESAQSQAEISSKNQFTVINCHVNELSERLKRLPSGRKQIAVTRYQDQITAIVNELDVIW
jgi:hypothetical protein